MNMILLKYSHIRHKNYFYNGNHYYKFTEQRKCGNLEDCLDYKIKNNLKLHEMKKKSWWKLSD